jgi:hypothetical protein
LQYFLKITYLQHQNFKKNSGFYTVVLLFQWDGDSGARGTRQLLSQRTSGSRDPIIGESAFLSLDKHLFFTRLRHIPNVP